MQSTHRLQSIPRWKTGCVFNFEESAGPFIETSCYRDAVSFMQGHERRSAWVCLDAPGMGKTVTVAKAAAAVGALHIHLECGAGVLLDAADKLCKLAQATTLSGAHALDVESFEALADAVWKTSIVSALSNETTQYGTRKTHSITMTDCVDWSLLEDSDRLDRFVHDTGKSARMRSLFHSETVVLHIDDIHALVDDDMLEEDVSDVFHKHAYKRFMHVLYELSSLFRIFVCITGRSSPANDYIIDCEFPVRSQPRLPYFEEDLTKQLLKQVLEFDDEAVCDELVDGCYGCPRAVQCVLLALQRRSTPYDAEDVLQDAYELWVDMSGFHRVDPVMMQAAFFAYDQTITMSYCREVDWAPFSRLSETSNVRLPREWLQAAKQGLVRIATHGNKTFTLPPHAFLHSVLRCSCSLQWSQLPPIDCLSLSRLGTYDSKSAAVIGAELCLANSPLAARIADAIESSGGPALLICPNNLRVRLLCYLENAPPAFVMGEYLYYGRESVSSDVCNMAVPFRLQDDPSSVVYVMVKLEWYNEDFGDRTMETFHQFIQQCDNNIVQWCSHACYIFSHPSVPYPNDEMASAAAAYNATSKHCKVTTVQWTPPLCSGCDFNITEAILDEAKKVDEDELLMFEDLPRYSTYYKEVFGRFIRASSSFHSDDTNLCADKSVESTPMTAICSCCGGVKQWPAENTTGGQVTTPDHTLQTATTRIAALQLSDSSCMSEHGCDEPIADIAVDTAADAQAVIARLKAQLADERCRRVEAERRLEGMIAGPGKQHARVRGLDFSIAASVEEKADVKDAITQTSPGLRRYGQPASSSTPIACSDASPHVEGLTCALLIRKIAHSRLPSQLRSRSRPQCMLLRGTIPPPGHRCTRTVESPAESTSWSCLKSFTY